MAASGPPHVPDPGELALAVPLIATLAAVTVTDLDRRMIPNRILLGSAATAVAIIAADDSGDLVPRLLAAAAAAGLLLVAALAHPGGMGMGDVKLAGVMGLYLGIAVAPAMLVALAAGFAVGIAMIARDGAATRKRTLPFAPFLAIGGIVGLVGGNWAVDWYMQTMLQ